MSRVVMLREGIIALASSEEVAEQLGEKAEQLKSRVKAPRKMQMLTRHGVGPRGAYSQVIMRGDGALAVEFGTRRSRPVAPLRAALRGFR